MAKKIPLRTAQALSLAGNISRDSLPKREKLEPEKPDPQVEIAMSVKQATVEQAKATMEIQHAFTNIAEMVLKMDERGKEQIDAFIAQLSQPRQGGKKTWRFQVTKRDKNGNIEEFTATED